MTDNAPASQDTLKKSTLLIYILFGVGLVFPVTIIVGLVMAYIKRSDAQGTIYATHMTWLIRTFWWSFVWGFAAMATMFLMGLGMIVAMAGGVWYIYRLVRGYLNFDGGKAIPE